MVRRGWRRESEVERGSILRSSDGSFAISYQRSLLRVVAFHKSAVGFIGSIPMTTHGDYASLRSALRKRWFYAFHNKEEEGRGRERAWCVKRERKRERTGVCGTCMRKPWNRDERNQRHIKLFARQTWLNIPTSLFHLLSAPIPFYWDS